MEAINQSNEVTDLLNEASSILDANEKLAIISKAVEMLLSRGGNLMLEFAPKIADFIVDFNPQVKSYIIKFMEDAAKLQPILLHQWLPILNISINDDNENVKKRAFTTINNLWRVILVLLTSSPNNETTRATFQVMREISARAVSLIKSPAEGLAIVAIKLSETIGICYSQPSGHATSGFKYSNKPNEWSLVNLQKSRGVLEANKLRNEGEAVVSNMVGYLSEISNNKIFTQMVNSLVTIVTHRTHFMNTIVPPLIKVSETVTHAGNKHILKTNFTKLSKLREMDNFKLDMEEMIPILGAADDTTKQSLVNEKLARASQKRSFSEMENNNEYGGGSNKRARTSPEAENVVTELPQHLAAIAALSPIQIIDMIFFNMQFLPMRPYGEFLPSGVSAVKLFFDQLITTQEEMSGRGSAAVSNKVWKLPEEKQRDIGDSERAKLINDAIDRVVQSSSKVSATGREELWQLVAGRLSIVLNDSSTTSSVDNLLNHIIKYYPAHHDLSIVLLYHLFVAVPDENQNNQDSYDKVLLKLTSEIYSLIVKDTTISQKKFVSLILDAPLLTKDVHQLICDSLFVEVTTDACLDVLKYFSTESSPWSKDSLNAILNASICNKKSIRSATIKIIMDTMFEVPSVKEQIISFVIQNISKLQTFGEKKKVEAVVDVEMAEVATSTEVLDVKIEATNTEATTTTAVITTPVVVEALSPEEERQIREESIQLLEIIIAVIPRQLELISSALETYSVSVKPVQEQFHAQAETLIRAILDNGGNANAVTVANFLKDTPKKAESLAVQLMSSLCDSAGLSPELILAGKEIEKKTKNTKFLIPILRGLSQDEIINKLPDIIKLPTAPTNVVKEAFEILLSNSSVVNVSAEGALVTENRSSPITPSQLLIALNLLPHTKRLLSAIDLCFDNFSVFNQNELGVVLSKLVVMNPPPNLICHTMIKTINYHPSMKGRVLEILGRLRAKEPWNMKDQTIWKGCKGVFALTKMDSFHLLLQLPREQLEEILNLEAFKDIIVPLSKHAQAPSRRNAIPRPILNLLDTLVEAMPKPEVDKNEILEEEEENQ